MDSFLEGTLLLLALCLGQSLCISRFIVFHFYCEHLQDTQTMVESATKEVVGEIEHGVFVQETMLFPWLM